MTIIVYTQVSLKGLKHPVSPLCVFPGEAML